MSATQPTQQSTNKRVAELLFIYSLTPTHPGTGRGGEIIDLQVQRDEFDIPVIWASGLKGVFRSNFTLRCGGNDACRNKVKAIFGPEAGSQEVSDYASSVVFLDARLLLIPARSLRGVWTYVTSPHLLNYYLTYLEALAEYSKNFEELSSKLTELVNNAKSDALGTTAIANSDRITVGNKVVLNELEFNFKKDDKNMTQKLLDVIPNNDLKNKVSQAGVVFVSDDVIREIIKRSLIVQARVRINYETKTVAHGALWEEEYLPQFTIMVSGLICSGMRRSLDKINDETVKKELEKLKEPNDVCRELRNVNSLMLGGKETVGKGLVKLWWYP